MHSVLALTAAACACVASAHVLRPSTTALTNARHTSTCEPSPVRLQRHSRVAVCMTAQEERDQDEMQSERQKFDPIGELRDMVKNMDAVVDDFMMKKMGNGEVFVCVGGGGGGSLDGASQIQIISCVSHYPLALFTLSSLAALCVCGCGFASKTMNLRLLVPVDCRRSMDGASTIRQARLMVNTPDLD